jgi:hypothetical protein
MVTIAMDIAKLDSSFVRHESGGRVRCVECGREYQMAAIEGVRTWDPKRVLDDFGLRAGGWRVDRHPRALVDVTGNGRADIVGFGSDGVWVALAKGDGTFESPRRVLDDFGAVAGRWRVDRHPRLLADVTGNGRADIVGFGRAGVRIALAKGDGTFAPAYRAIDDFGFAQGWRVGRHPRLLADVMGEGRADIVGFGPEGVWLAPNLGEGQFGPARDAVEGFGLAGGWRGDRHPRQLIDLTGDGRADIVGFGEAGVWVALNEGDGRFGPPALALADFGPRRGWRTNRHPRFVADVTGDGRPDIVGFGERGVWVALNEGGGRFGRAQRVIDDFGAAAGGWRVDRHPRMLADLTGNGRSDIVGFGPGGSIVVAMAKGDGTFESPQQIIDDFGADAGWWPDRHPVMLADVTGDGRADIVGFGAGGVHVAVTTVRAAGPNVLVQLEEHSELPTARRQPSVVGPRPLDAHCRGHHHHNRLRSRRT